MECREVQHGSDEYRQTVALREKILREPLGLKLEPSELATEQDSLHLVCCDGTRILGCLVLEPLAAGQVKMRQVAVDTDRQRQGVGTRLIEFSEALATRYGFHEIRMHAREAVVPFYERLGYEKQGEPFIEVTIEHIAMHKHL